MRVTLPILAVVALAACEPEIPASNAGAGFQDYQTYQRERALRERQLQGLGPAAAAEVAAEAELAEAPVTVLPPDAQPAPESDAEATAAAALAAIGRAEAAPAPAPAAPAPAAVGQPLSPNFRAESQTAPAAAPAPATDTTGISDEQNFSAVAERESIESDAERLRRQREAFEVVEPEPLPSRTNSGPNIVAYALSTTNAVGQPVYRRTFGSANRAARACGRYSSPDLAQEAFLASGGPERDREGMDPDGDGFACGWDPRPFRAVRN